MPELDWRGLIYLDANVFIDAYEGEPSLSEPAKALLDHLRRERGLAVTSELSLAEVLVRPETEGNVIGKRAYLDLLVWSGCVELVPVTRDLLYLSARLRGVHSPKLRLADSIHLATSVERRCQVFVSRDAGIVPPDGARRMQADRDGPDAILGAVR